MESSKSQGDVDYSSIKVIVIDDDLDVRDVFVDLLKMYGINVVGTGSNAIEAIELYMTYNPDFVFMDYLMPTHNGLYGAEKIREFDPYARIILVSGSYFENGAHDNLVNAILEKPISITEVLNTINEMISTVNAK
jgi:two-component system, chemotaxis family, chemotaxis protein CheY